MNEERLSGEDASPTVVPAEPEQAARAEGLYSDTLSAHVVATTGAGLAGISNVVASNAGERVFLSMRGLTCSVTEDGTQDYDVDVEPTDDSDTVDTGVAVTDGHEEVVGTGDGEWMLVASPQALYRLNVVEDHIDRRWVAGVVAAQEQGGVLTALDDRGVLTQWAGGHVPQLTVELGDVFDSFALVGDDVVVAGQPTVRVDGSGVAHSLDFDADYVVADASTSRLFGRWDDALVARTFDGDALWRFQDGEHLRDVGILPERGIAWAHYLERNGENQVVLLDQATGEVLGEFVLDRRTRHVAASGDGDTMVFASSSEVEQYRFE